MNRLLKEVVQSPSLGGFEIQLDQALSNTVGYKSWSCFMLEAEQEMS